MTHTQSSSSSYSFADVGVGKLKFLCSHSGRILPRPSDGKLRYVGGETRVVAVDRCVSFPELQLRMEQLCGRTGVSLRCQLPAEDLDALVSVTCDEDLSNLVEEHRAASSGRPPLTIRAFLHSRRPLGASASPSVARSPPPGPMVHRRLHRVLSPSGFCGRYAAPCHNNYHQHQHQHQHQHDLVHHGNLQRTHHPGMRVNKT